MTFNVPIQTFHPSPNGLVVKNEVVKYLTEEDFVDNWQMKLPRYRFEEVKKMVDNNEVVSRVVSPMRRKIILSQLPPHLWDREPKILRDEDGKVVEYLYKDKKYVWWYVRPTPVDDEIRELKSELRFIPEMNKERVKELLGIIEDNKAGGWLVKRGWRALKDPEHFMSILYS
jgi:uncharacterized protein YlbG (UPF0298 family)